MNSQTSWGVVATIKAPTKDILDFAAYHLDLGAKRVHVYLDDDDPVAHKALKSHSKCRVHLCDETYWRKRKGRPDQHQLRQSINATHCYRRASDVDWLAHIDVDEFLCPSQPLALQLAELPDSALTAQLRPIEALAPDPFTLPPNGQVWAKGCASRLIDRRAQTQEIYPTFGNQLNGGFLSHVSGKIFVRTGRQGFKLRIHNAFFNGTRLTNAHVLQQTQLLHMHAPSWAHWRRSYRYRLNQGAYRAELQANARFSTQKLSMHELLSSLETEGGEPALQAFFTEVCVATPQLREKLSAHGHLHAVSLGLDAKRKRHFADAV
ncbi:glycosyltransferase family 2 protein [Roseovarius sp. EL26]|uniref:glycosyltransferase family 2 protein n=1 Tax=Roseovarius sp. EL26 TaxID=2126672 RepID=UPI000EA14F47|nr:glycosyltransferase family 2 protein [Roseovarius sp. EL26]